MAYAGQSCIPPKVLEGRRALHWWWATAKHGQYTPNQLMRSRGPQEGWSYQLVKPKRKYGVADGSQGSKKRKVHIVRDQVRGVKEGFPEALLTRWRCGSYTFSAKLQSEVPEKVCYQCFIRDQNQTTISL